MTDTPQKKLYRHPEDRMISGLSRGLGDYLNLDTGIVRIIWVVLFIVTGGAPVLTAYLLAWWLVPDTNGQRTNTPLIWLAVLILLPLLVGCLIFAFGIVMTVQVESALLPILPFI
jgi:phage shock protein PspC (stress-responsive transcriptional regulator)